jgi:hypothetical protein
MLQLIWDHLHTRIHFHVNPLLRTGAPCKKQAYVGRRAISKIARY